MPQIHDMHAAEIPSTHRLVAHLSTCISGIPVPNTVPKERRLRRFPHIGTTPRIFLFICSAFFFLPASEACLYHSLMPATPIPLLWRVNTRGKVKTIARENSRDSCSTPQHSVSTDWVCGILLLDQGYLIYKWWRR